MSSPALAVVAAVIDGWQHLNAEAVADCFSENGIWHNMPYAPIAGRTEIAAGVARFISDVASVRFNVHHIGEIAPDIVIAERNDIFEMKDGRRIDIPVMGIFEIVDGKIRSWRDYFDGGVMND